MFPPCYLTWGQTMVELMKIMATSFKSSPARTATLSPRSPPKQATTNPHVCWTLLGESESVSCGVTAPFSWVLMHKVLFVPSKSLFPQSSVSSGSMVWFMATSSKRAYAISRTLHPESLPLRQATPESYLLRRHSNTVELFGVSGTWCAQGLFEPSEHFW